MEQSPERKGDVKQHFFSGGLHVHLASEDLCSVCLWPGASTPALSALVMAQEQRFIDQPPPFFLTLCHKPVSFTLTVFVSAHGLNELDLF